MAKKAAGSKPQGIIHPVILSGGAGMRLWPLSRAHYPKQLLPLVSGNTMLQETARRIDGEGFAAPIVICNDEHRFIVAEQLRALEAGMRIDVAFVDTVPLGVDTPRDLARARELLGPREGH